MCNIFGKVMWDNNLKRHIRLGEVKDRYGSGTLIFDMCACMQEIYLFYWVFYHMTKIDLVLKDGVWKIWA